MDRFCVVTNDGQRTELSDVTVKMSVTVTVPPWRDLMCLDILVEAQDVGCGEEPLDLGFSSQWMDVPVASLTGARRSAVFDGLHVTWPHNSVNDPLQPPASVSDGRHAMVSAMDLRLSHKAGAIYRLTVQGATEFAEAFEIEVDVVFGGFTVMNDDRNKDVAVEKWFEDHLSGQGMAPAWRTLKTANGDLFFYEAQYDAGA